MLSAIIYYECSYSTVTLVKQSMNNGFAFPGPLVLRFTPFNFLHLRKIGTKLFHNVLNSDHVPPSLANSQTLGTTYSPRMRWSNIEVPNHSVDRVSREWLACYPWRTFYSLSDDHFYSESPDHYSRLTSLFDLSVLQSSKYMYYYAFKLILFNSNLPLRASVTLWEATAPVKLPIIHDLT